MMKKLRGGWLRTGLLCVAGALIVGCGQSTGDRVPLSGEVTLDGEPLDQGSIEFHPEGEGLVLTGGPIQDGRFEIPAKQGAKPGSYVVRIFSAAEGAPVNPDQPPGPEAVGQVSEERIPPQYNTDSELEVVVGEAGADDLRFEISRS